MFSSWFQHWRFPLQVWLDKASQSDTMGPRLLAFCMNTLFKFCLSEYTITKIASLESDLFQCPADSITTLAVLLTILAVCTEAPPR